MSCIHWTNLHQSLSQVPGPKIIIFGKILINIKCGVKGEGFAEHQATHKYISKFYGKTTLNQQKQWISAREISFQPETSAVKIVLT